jgi:hypothetical protein
LKVDNFKNVFIASTPFYLSFFFCGLFYKHIAIVNYDSRIVNKLGASLTDDARVIIYDRHVFIVQAIGSERQLDLNT